MTPLNLPIIRKWVDEQGSVIKAAQLLGMQRPNLSRLLAGDNADIKISTLVRLCDVMDVDPNDLIRRAKIV